MGNNPSRQQRQQRLLIEVAGDPPRDNHISLYATLLHLHKDNPKTATIVWLGVLAVFALLLSLLINQGDSNISPSHMTTPPCPKPQTTTPTTTPCHPSGTRICP